MSDVLNALIPGAGTLLNSIMDGGQSFTTIPLSNSRLALYTISINGPEAPYSSIATYTFPLTPSALIKSYAAMTNIFDVSNPSAPGGIERVVDTYGNSPIIYTIEGTTGWQLHSADGFSFTGLQSIIALQQMFQQFASLNAQQAINNLPPYTMEFFDYFQGDFWQIVPLGRQEVRQNRSRPLYVDYLFRFAGLRSLAEPLLAKIADPVLSILQNPQATAINTTVQLGSRFLTNYLSLTPGALSLPGVTGSAVTNIITNSIGDFGGGSLADIGSTSNSNVTLEDLF